MATTLNFKDLIDLPQWRTLANSINSTAAASCICGDNRNDISRDPYLYLLINATTFQRYNTLNDEWQTLTSPALAGTFGAGAGSVFVPSAGPSGTLASGNTTTSVVLSTALPATVGVNQLANRGDGIGYKIRIIGNASGSSGKMKYLLKIPYKIKLWIKELNRWIELRYVFVQKIVTDSKASGEMQKIIGLAISLLIASSIMPVTLTNLAEVNTTGWDSTAKTLWPLLSIFGVLAIVLIFMRYVTKK
jgi:hypothetical protein